MVLKSLFGKKSEAPSPKADVPGMGGKPAQAENSSTRAPGAEAHDSPTQAESKPGEPPTAVYLEQAMLENARSDTPDSRKKVYQELLFSDLLLALADPEPGTSPEAAAEANKDPNNLSVAILSNSGGIQFAAVFTSAAAARRWRAEGGQYVSVRGQDIFKLLEPSPAEVVVVNAGSAPFIVLPKVEYRQLAMGIVPQGGPSPVQVAAGGPAQQNEGPQGGANDGQMQVAFPPDVFSEAQKEHALGIMQPHANVEAAVLGAILPPGAGENGWVRTLFLRVTGVEENQEAMQKFCAEIRTSIASHEELFKETGFEVGVMPDPNFWVAMNQNGIILFDKNPPAAPMDAVKEGVVDASLEDKA
jgi:hypothetical protein